MTVITLIFYFFFFNDTATTEIYTLSLHDALPICGEVEDFQNILWQAGIKSFRNARLPGRLEPVANIVRLQIRDRKSTRLNSSHSQISYAVFCLKKKKTKTYPTLTTSS